MQSYFSRTMYWRSEPQKQDLCKPFCTYLYCTLAFHKVFQPFTIFATFLRRYETDMLLSQPSKRDVLMWVRKL